MKAAGSWFATSIWMTPKIPLTLDIFAVLGCWEQTSVIWRAEAGSGSIFRHIKHSLLTQTEKQLLRNYKQKAQSEHKAIMFMCCASVHACMQTRVTVSVSRASSCCHVDQSPSSGGVRNCSWLHNHCCTEQHVLLSMFKYIRTFSLTYLIHPKIKQIQLKTFIWSILLVLNLIFKSALCTYIM